MKKILVVDDNIENLYMRKMLLESKNFNVITENDAAKATEIVKKEKPDLVISDIQMPEFDGFDLCYAIRHEKRTRKIPIILITAAYQELNTNLLKVLNLGANDYIVAPVDHEELIFRIHKLLEETTS